MEKATLGPQVSRDRCEFDSVKEIPSKMKSIHAGKMTGNFRVAFLWFGCSISYETTSKIGDLPKERF